MELAEIRLLLQQVNTINQDEITVRLQAAVNHLIVADFEKLVQLLYVVDINEKRLKSLLQEKPNVDAAQIITELLIARQLQKMETRRRQQNGKPTDSSEDEKW